MSKLPVFLSWSGDRSLKVAQVLETWFPSVIQALDPWLSASGIAKGKRWSPEIADRLEQSRFGVFCITPENLHEDWMLFEAGAITKTAGSRGYTFLLGLRPSEVSGPLADFQHTVAEKDDVLKLVRSMNKALDDIDISPVSDAILTATFEKYWPEFEEVIREMLDEGPPEQVTQRAEREILEEILDRVRQTQDQRAPRVQGGLASLGRFVQDRENIIGKVVRRLLTLEGVTVNHIEHGDKDNVSTVTVHFIKDGRGGATVFRYGLFEYLDPKDLGLEVARSVMTSIQHRTGQD